MLVVFLSVPAAIAQEPTVFQAVPPAPLVAAKHVNPADSLRKTTVYRVKYAAAQEVAWAVNHELTTMLGEKPKHEGFIVDSPVVIIPEVITNSLLISAKPAYMDKILGMIRKLDKAPTQIMVQFLIEEIEDGKATVLSRPQVMTLDGAEAIIEIGSEKKKMRVSLTPHIVQWDDERKHRPNTSNGEATLFDRLSRPSPPMPKEESIRRRERSDDG